MPDDDSHDERDDDLDDRIARLPTKDLRALRAKAKQADLIARRIAVCERAIAFLRVPGLDPKDPKARLFIAGYEGSLDPLWIEDEAIATGVLPEVE